MAAKVRLCHEVGSATNHGSFEIYTERRIDEVSQSRGNLEEPKLLAKITTPSFWYLFGFNVHIFCVKL